MPGNAAIFVKIADGGTVPALIELSDQPEGGRAADHSVESPVVGVPVDHKQPALAEIPESSTPASEPRSRSVCSALVN